MFNKWHMMFDSDQISQERRLKTNLQTRIYVIPKLKNQRMGTNPAATFAVAARLSVSFYPDNSGCFWLYFFLIDSKCSGFLISKSSFGP